MVKRLGLKQKTKNDKEPKRKDKRAWHCYFGNERLDRCEAIFARLSLARDFRRHRKGIGLLDWTEKGRMRICWKRDEFALRLVVSGNGLNNGEVEIDLNG